MKLRTIVVLGIAGCVTVSPATMQTHGLVVHEWGTFTSVAASTGETLGGLQHTDELLPDFVHSRDYTHPRQKGMEGLPELVTQKLETPVLYFHTDTPLHVRVDVGFPQGVVSEWYPDSIASAPAMPIAKLAGGAMTWEGDLDGPAIAPPPVDDSSIWAPSRRVQASPFRVAAEQDDFIFYRGLGRFTLPLTVTSDANGQTRVANDSDDEIPAAFYLYVHPGGGIVVPLGPIAAHGSVVVNDSPTPKEDPAGFVATAQGTIAASLEETGLYTDEAQAMVDTWTRSYFQSAGRRVLYVVPRAWTDALLPTTIAPRPVEYVRTLVGRVEVLTFTEEQQILADATAAAAGGAAIAPDAYGRFTEAKLRRAAELATDPNVAAVLAQAIAAASATP